MRTLAAPDVPGYDVEARIGGGRSGDVYRVRRLDSGETQALKVAHPSPGGSAERIAFRQEYDLHSRLRHPHIVQAFHFGEAADLRPFYTMEYVDAVPLRELYRRSGVDALAEVALAVCRALEYAHGQNLLHGDIKPANLLVSAKPDGRVDRALLGDFGHARPLGQGAASVQGTLAYLAPEEIDGWLTDVRSDLYSLGVTLFEAITGRLPYPASTATELFRIINEVQGPPRLAETASDLDPRWAKLVDSMIARNPALRPRSATEVASAVAALLGRSLRRDGPHGDGEAVFGTTLAFVGRAAERHRLLQLLRDPGSARTVLVTGIEGVGKSRFVEEFARSVELDGARVFRTDARGESGSAFRVLRRVRGEGRCEDLTAGGSESRADHSAPAGSRAELEALVDRLVGGPESMDLERVFVFDSLESADLDSADFLRALGARLAGTRSLLLLVAETAAGGAAVERLRGPDVEEIALGPLSSSEIRELLVAHLGDAAGAPGSSVPLDDVELDRLVAWTERHAGGNPRLLEAVLRALVRQGYLRRAEAGWHLDEAALERRPLPLAPRERVAERMRLLSPAGRAYLELAAVCGSEFDASALSAGEGFDAESASTFLTDAMLAGILVLAPGRTSAYRFADPTVRRVLLDGLDEETRGDLHRRVARHLQSTGAAADASLAEHLELAGEAALARETYALAGEAARAAGAFQEAARCFENAWRLPAPAGEAALPAFALGWLDALHVNGQFGDAVLLSGELLARAADLPRSRPDVAHVLVSRAACLGQLGRRDEAQQTLRSLLDSEPPPEDRRLRARALIQYGQLEAHANRKESARKYLLEARELAAREGFTYEGGKAELFLGVVCWRENDPEGALEWLARAQDHLVEARGDDLLPAVWGNQAICHWYLLDARKAAAAHRRAADGYLRQHRRSEAARSYQNLAHVLTETGRWQEAERALEAAERLNRTLSGPRHASYFHYGKARLALYRGRLDEAASHAERAVTLGRSVDDAIVTCGHLCLRGLVEITSGRHEAARRTGEEALAAARAIDYGFGLAKSLWILGEAARQRGETDEALRLLEDARAAATDAAHPAPVALLRIQLSRAELIAERGDESGAESLLGECRALADRCDSTLWRGLLALGEGRVRTLLGGFERARQALAPAYETFATLGAELLRAETLIAQASAQAGLGGRTAAYSALRAGRSIYQSLGVPAPRSPFPDDEAPEEGSLPTVRRVLEAAAAVSRDITTLQSVDEVLRRILDVAITHLGTERGVVALANPQTGELEVKFARNIDRESISGTLEISRSTLAMVSREGDVIHSRDALDDPDLRLHESVRRGRIRSLISLPIRWGDRTLGALYMDHRTLTDLFGPEERLFLRFIADMAAIGIRNAQQFEIKEEAVRSLRGELEDDELVFPATVVGRSGRFRDLLRRALRAMRSGRIVLLTGPSGCGKDHLARVLHDAVGRRGPFVNCPLPNLPETLLEAELFGVAPGAATQTAAREGLVDAAGSGTLFLNEVADLPVFLQAKLLHFLESREYRRVGSTKTLHSEAAILGATNANLERKVAEGSFREDLFYRMSECTLEIPPLRERREDIPLLAELFLGEEGRLLGRPRPVLDPAAMDLLMRCPWDGNIREFETCLKGAVHESKDGYIEPRHLDSPSLRRFERDGAGGGFRDEVELVERRRILDALERSGGIIARAAVLLDLPASTLRRKIVRHRLRHLVTQRRRKKD
jgi:Nif-specific regulatory protein